MASLVNRFGQKFAGRAAVLLGAFILSTAQSSAQVTPAPIAIPQSAGAPLPVPEVMPTQAPTPDNSATTVLPPVTVKGTAARYSLTQPPTAAQARALQTVPGGTNLVDSEQYKVHRSSNLYDALEGQPGVYIEQRGGTDQVKLSIRGAGLDRTFNVRGIKLLQDGVPLSQADGDGDFQAIEPLALRDIEVYRGANGLKYGATTLGGAINFVSPTGYTASKFQSRIEPGSYGYLKEQISSGQVIGKFDYYASMTGYSRHGYQAHSKTNAERFNGNFGYRIRPNLETRFYVSYVNSRLQLAGGLTKDQVFRTPRAAQTTAVDFNQRRNGDYERIANKTTWQINDHARLDVDAYWTRRFLYHPLFWNPNFLNGLGILHLVSNTFGGDIRYTNTRDVFGRHNNFTAGFDPCFSPAKDRRYQNIRDIQGRMTSNGKEFWSNLDWYAQNEHNLSKKLALVAGMQISYATRNYLDNFAYNPNGNQTKRLHYSGYNPKVGFIYNMSPDAQIYTNFSRSFEPPTGVEIVQIGGRRGDIRTVNLKAQRASSFEIGTRGAGRRIAWDATYYFSWVENELLTLNNSIGQPVGTMNAPRTHHQGVESGVSLIVADGIFAKTSMRESPMAARSVVGPGLTPLLSTDQDRIVLRTVYNWTSLHFSGDSVYGNNQLPGIPAHLMQASLNYEHPSGFYVGPNIKWSMAHTPGDYANTINMNPYFIIGVRAGYRANNGLSAFVEMRNIANSRYASVVEVVANARQAGGNPQIFVPGEGRAVYVGVDYRH